MSTLILMSEKELDRLELVQRVCQKRMTVTAAAAQASLSRQRMSVLVNVYRRDGQGALVSRKRGMPSNNRSVGALRKTAVSVVRAHYSDFGPQCLTSAPMRQI